MGTQTDNSRYTGYPLFKGLQRPLELMGLQGRYIYWAAGAVGGAILGFILAYCLIGFLAGLLTLVASLAVGAGFILLKHIRGTSNRINYSGEKEKSWSFDVVRVLALWIIDKDGEQIVQVH